MLCALLKLGVLKPAGASVADFAATLASPVPNAATAAKRQEHRRTFLQWGMSMSVPPKDTVAYANSGCKLADLLTSTSQGRVDRSRVRPEVRSPVTIKTGLARDYSHLRRKKSERGEVASDGWANQPAGNAQPEIGVCGEVAEARGRRFPDDPLAYCLGRLSFGFWKIESLRAV